MGTPGKRVRPNRPVERAAVRAVTAVFEDANFLVQAVDGANDIGKDLYVDVTEAGRVTGELIAVQVKGGGSYRRKGGYAIPCSADDLALWATSTVPVIGIVHEPDGGQLHWVNLTAWARAQTTPPSPMEVPVASTWRLDARTLAAFVAEARGFLAASGPPALVGLADPDPGVQRAAIYDAFALGRRDPRALRRTRAPVISPARRPGCGGAADGASRSRLRLNVLSSPRSPRALLSARLMGKKRGKAPCEFQPIPA